MKVIEPGKGLQQICKPANWTAIKITVEVKWHRITSPQPQRLVSSDD
jgi:hypothetical protein